MVDDSFLLCNVCTSLCQGSHEKAIFCIHSLSVYETYVVSLYAIKYVKNK